MGTGFSYVQNGAYAQTLPQVGQEFVYFLREFVQAFPEYAAERHQEEGPGGPVDVYLAGESYAGQFVPYIADALIKSHTRAPVHLAGIAIGNGYLDPRAQAGSEIDMLVAHNIWAQNGREVRELAPVLSACRAALAKDARPRLEYPDCDAILQKLLDISTRTVDGKAFCLNAYDMRLVDTSPACGMNWPKELASTYAFLRRPDVRRALHVNDERKPEAWIECNTAVGRPIHAHANDTDASVTLLPGLLEAHVPVLLFAGDQDVICNYVGLERMIDALTWGGQRGLQTPTQDWRINGEQVGTWRTDRNLTWVKVHNASHMAAYDQPLAAHDMMLRFMDVDMNLGTGVKARNTSTVGLDARILVPERSTQHLAHNRPASSAAPTHRPTSTAASQPAAHADRSAQFDLLGNLFVLALIALAVGGCVWVRRRTRVRAGPYQAVGQYVLSDAEGAGRVLRSPTQAPARHDVEMEPFTLEGEEEEERASP